MRQYVHVYVRLNLNQFPSQSHFSGTRDVLHGHCTVFLGPIRDVLTTGKMDSSDGSKKYSYNSVRKKAD